MTEKRILILTSDAGFGHRSAAQAIESALTELYGEQCQCKVANPTDSDDSPDLIQKLEMNMTNGPSVTLLYELSYYTLDTLLSQIWSGLLQENVP